MTEIVFPITLSTRARYLNKKQHQPVSPLKHSNFNNDYSNYRQYHGHQRLECVRVMALTFKKSGWFQFAFCQIAVSVCEQWC